MSWDSPKIFHSSSFLSSNWRKLKRALSCYPGFGEAHHVRQFLMS